MAQVRQLARLTFQSLEDRTTPATAFPILSAEVVTTGTVSPNIDIMAGASPALIALDFDPSRVATADVNGDGANDFITVSKAGEVTHVKVLDGKDSSRTLVETKDVFEATYLGGAHIDAGDLDGDGTAEIVVSASLGGSGRVVVLKYEQQPTIAIFPPPPPTFGLNSVASFFAIEDANFRGGSTVAVEDMNGDARADVIVAAGVGGGPRVAIYDGVSVSKAAPTRLVNDFFALPDLAFRGGISVDAGDVDADGKADLIVGSGVGGGQRTRVISGVDVRAGKGASAAPLADFFLGGQDNGNRFGVIVAYEPPYDKNAFGGLSVFGSFLDTDGKLTIAGAQLFIGKNLPKPAGTVPDIDERAFVQ